MLAVRPSCLYVVCPFIWSVVVRLLGVSFAFFDWLCAIGKNANVHLCVGYLITKFRTIPIMIIPIATNSKVFKVVISLPCFSNRSFV